MFSKFQPSVKDGKERQLDVTRRIEGTPRSSSCGKLLDHDEKIPFETAKRSAARPV
jgi:hypothetical protein